MRHYLTPGDWVVYKKPKRGKRPGPRAQQIHASEKGDFYSYVVDKYWVVEDVLDNGNVVMLTRTGKTHEISADDPNIRKADFLSWLFLRHRYRAVEALAARRRETKPTTAIPVVTKAG